MPSPELGRIRPAVVDIVAGDAACAARAACAMAGWGGAEAWENALDLAIGWGVLPAFRERVDESLLPESVRARLRSTSLAVTVRSAFVMHRSADALRVLERAGIDTVTIKGVGLIAALGRSPSSRATSDLDVVVRERDAPQARRILQADGYVEINPEFEQHMWQIGASRQLHNFARALRRDDFEVDLHWRFGPQPPRALDAERLLRRAVTATLARRAVRVADPVDGVLLNVYHALRGSFLPHNTVRDLCDLKVWWESGTIGDRFDELVDEASASGFAPSLCALWGAIGERDPGHALSGARERLHARLGPHERSDAVLLQQYFEDSLREGVPANFTLEVFSPRLYVRSVIEHAFRGIGNAGAPRRSGQPDAAARGLERRPLVKRLAGLAPRIARVVRDLSRVRDIPSYRAVARAQRRFH